MPCFGPDGPPDYLTPDGGRMRREFERRELDRATQAACELARLMPPFDDGAWDEISPATIRWIKEHRKLDAKRAKKKGSK